jgi:hypothetical protein
MFEAQNMVVRFVVRRSLRLPPFVAFAQEVPAPVSCILQGSPSPPSAAIAREVHAP